jgi:hypothetical protein
VIHSLLRRLGSLRGGLSYFWIASIVAAGLSMEATAHASLAFGPKDYVVKPGLPMPAIERFPACQPGKGGQLRVENGPNGRARVALAVVVLNQGDALVMLEGPGQRRLVERTVPLATSNTLLVWMIGPPGATLSVSVTSAGACLDLAITSPLPGASVPEGLLHARGTVVGPAGVGVAVNGVPAAVQGGEFAVVLDVDPGSTELVATATTPGGDTAEARQVVNVLEAPESPVRLLAGPVGGVPPLTVGFSLSALVGITDVKLDLDGNGSVEFEGPTLDGQTFTYGQPGLYVATVQATDVDGQVQSASTLVEVYDPAVLDAQLRAVWTGFKGAVRGGDVTRAVSFLHSERRDAFADQLRLLRPQTLAKIDTYLTTIQLVEVGPKGAEYEMLRSRDGVTQSFAVWFRVDQDGVWRLFAF